MIRLAEFLDRLARIRALPAHAMTYAVILIWLTGAMGLPSAANWWHQNAGTTTAFVQISLGIWLLYRVGGKVAMRGRKQQD